MIRDFIRSGNYDNPVAVSRHCYAITQLARFPTDATREFLKGLLQSKGFLGLGKSPRPIRQAAKTALMAMK